MARKFEVDNVLLDCSGTLINDLTPVYNANMQTLRLHGVPTISFDEWRDISPRCVSSRDVYTIVCGNNGIERDYGAMCDDYSRIYQKAREEFPPEVYHGVADTLESLNEMGKVVGVVSSHPQDGLEVDLAKFGLDRYVAFTCGSVYDKAGKLKEISAAHRMHPPRTCYVGDTNKDLNSARDAGMIAIANVGGYVSELVIDNTLRRLEKAGHPCSKIYGMPELLEILI